MRRETDEVRMATSGTFGNLIQYSFTFLFCFILAMWRAPILALVTLSTIPAVVLVQIISQVLIGPMLEQERRAFAEASTNVERTTGAISTVKAHNAESTECERFRPLVFKAQDALIKQARVWAVTVGSSETLLLSTFVLGFWYGAKLVREGKANPGDVMTVFWAALLAATYMQMVVEQLVIVTKGKTSMASLRTIIRDFTRTTYFWKPILSTQHACRCYFRQQDPSDKYAPNPTCSMSWGIQFPKCIILLPLQT
jgi:ATP-binding cassette subfamily B (MDR/TAP) protein 1